ncbi:MAG TPA: DUF4870 domain-containing protein, partial [Thermodesulfovibrionales bacterium]|nr:DUF4870 domain-containing protein [Thermodesulfovibrionales bacterium]
MTNDVEQKVRNWGMLCHLGALAAFLGIPLGHLLGPFIIWLIKKNDHPFIDEQGKESLNFQISMSIYSIVAVSLIL